MGYVVQTTAHWIWREARRELAHRRMPSPTRPCRRTKYMIAEFLGRSAQRRRISEKDRSTGPDERHAILKAPEIVLELGAPEFVEHSENPGPRTLAGSPAAPAGCHRRARGNCCRPERPLSFSPRGALNRNLFIHRREQERGVGEGFPQDTCARMPLRGPAMEIHEIEGGGRPAYVDRMKSTTACSDAPTNPVGPTTT